MPVPARRSRVPARKMEILKRASGCHHLDLKHPDAARDAVDEKQELAVPIDSHQAALKLRIAEGSAGQSG
jgi:hypothetical protein